MKDAVGANGGTDVEDFFDYEEIFARICRTTGKD